MYLGGTRTSATARRESCWAGHRGSTTPRAWRRRRSGFGESTSSGEGLSRPWVAPAGDLALRAARAGLGGLGGSGGLGGLGDLGGSGRLGRSSRAARASFAGGPGGRRG